MSKAAHGMRAVYAIRKNNLRALVGPASRFESQQELAAALGKSPAYLSQMIGKKPIRNITEASAREFEQKLDLPAQALDVAEPAE